MAGAVDLPLQPLRRDRCDWKTVSPPPPVYKKDKS